MYINPYIEQVAHHPKIFSTDTELKKHAKKWKTYFDNPSPIHLEIGTGLGNFFSTYVAHHPSINMIGMEIKYKRLVKTAQKTEKFWANNFVLLKAYGETICDLFWAWELEKIFIFFPDPWPKKRHWKHRLIQHNFVQDLHTVLQPGGKIIFKTDDRPYFDWTQEHISAHDWLMQTAYAENYEQYENLYNTQYRTEFEIIWRNQWKPIYYVEYTKTS